MSWRRQWLEGEEANQGGADFFPRRLRVFFSKGVQIGFRFYSMKGLFLKIKRSRILLDQGDQLFIEFIKIFQESDGQDHLIV